MKKLSLVVLFAILSACKSEQGEAIHAKVLLPSVSATCVRFEVRDPSDDRVIESRWLPRRSNDDDLRIAIFRGSLPETVKIAARPYLDGNCDGGQEARTPNGPFESVNATFVKDDVIPADLTLKPGTDGDGDGYVGTGAGGADCQDGQRDVNPGVQEQCSDQVDRNCDDRKGCQASTCAANACIGPPANLALTLQSNSVQAGTCSSATVQVKDTNGSDTRVGAATVVNLQANPAGGTAFYSDAGCTMPATSVTLAMGEASTTFYFQGLVTGDVTITATATGLRQDSRVAQVAPGQGNRLVFTSPVRTTEAGACSQIVQFELRDAQNNPAQVASATAIALAASTATDFTFYSNSNCTTAVTSLNLAAGSTGGSFYFRGTRSGPVTMTLTALGLTGSSQGATINPGSPTAMVFTGPTVLQAGDCSAPVTIELRDTFGNPASAGSNTTINLTTTGAVALTYSTSSTCTPTTTNVSIAQGSGTVSFRYRGTAAGSAIISGNATGLTPTPLNVTVTPAPAATLVFTTTAQTLTAGSCSAVARVQLRDAFNNTVSVSADAAVALAAAPSTGFQFFTDSGCATPAVTSVNIPASASEASFYFRGTSAGTPVMSATVSGVTAATQSVTINPGSPTVLAFSPASLTATAGDCTQVTLRSTDGFGNPSNVSTNQAVSLTASPSGGFSFSTASNCSSTVTQVTISASQNSVTLFVRGTVSGSVTVTGSRTGFTSGTLAVTVNPAAPNKLAFQTAPQTLEVGVCSGIATVRLLDTFNNVTTAGSNTQINLSGSTGTLSFYSDAACASPATSTTVTAGQSSASFYFKDSAVGTVTITAASTGLMSITQQQTINPGAPTQLAFTSQAQTLTAGGCSAPVQFQSQDAQGNASPVAAATTVALAASPATGFRFYSDASCTTEITSVTLAANASSGSFRFKGTRSGTVSVTLEATGFTGGSQNQTINAGAPTAMVFTGPQTLTAGDCSAPVTIELRDSFGNTAVAGANTSITLSTVAGGVALTFSTNSTCTPTTTSVSIAQGASTASFRYRGTAAGSATITGTATGLTPTPLSVTVTPAPAATLVFTTAAQTLTAGNCSAVARVQLRDAFNNPASVSADTAVALSAAPSTGFQFFTDSGCATPAVTSVNIPASASEASFYFRGTSAGTPMMSATVSGVTAATQSVTINPGPPTVLVFSQPSLTIAAGVCTQVTLLVQDTHGNASTVSSNTAITFAASPSTGFTFSVNADCSSPGTQFNVNSGQSSRVLHVRGTAAGAVTVTASRTGFTSGTLAVTVNPAAPNKLAFQTAPQTVDLGVCSGITTVQVQDTFNNATPVAADTAIGLAGSTGTISFYSDAGCNNPVTSVTVQNGQNSASFYFKDTNAATVTITASSAGLANATQAQTINPVAPTALVFATGPQTVAATGCSGVTTVETWAGGTPTTVTSSTTVNLGASPSTGFTFYSNSTCTTLVTSVTISAGQGSANFYFKGTTPGTVTITASSTNLTSATQEATITLQPSKLLFTTPARTTTAGACSSIVTVQTADASNNGVPAITNTTVNLSQSGTPADPQFRFYSDASCSSVVTSVTIPARQTTANFYTKGQLARTVTLTAAATGLTSATQEHTVLAGTAAALVFSGTTGPQTLLASACSNIRTVEARDAFNNLATNGVTFNLTGSLTAEFFLDVNCTTPLTTPVSIPAGSSSTSFYFKGITGGINANGTLTLTATPTTAGVTPATQNETIIPTVRTGSCVISNTSTTCSITPALLDINKAFLVFQATSTNTTSDLANVRCFLNSTSLVRCERPVGLGGAADDVNIRWSVAEFPSRVAVQHVSTSCTGDTTPVNFSSNVTMDRTFLLFSSQRDVTNMGNSVPRVAVLTSTSQAEIRKTGGCAGVDNNHVQAVDYMGATVRRGVTTLSNGSASTQVNTDIPSQDLTRMVLLYSFLSDGQGPKICDRILRGELTNNGAKATFSRGDGDTTNCLASSFTSIAWTAVQFPEGTVVQQVTQPLAMGSTQGNASISAVDLSRTIVIGGGQWASGQVHGEGRHSSSDLISEMRAQAFLNDSTTLTFFRESSNNTARFTAYVVQLKP